MSRYYLNKEETILETELLHSLTGKDSVIYIEKLKNTYGGNLYILNSFNTNRAQQEFVLKEDSLCNLRKILNLIVDNIEKNNAI